MPKTKIDLLEHFFTKVVDNGTYFSCTIGDNKREWMYSKKMIGELGHNKLLKIIKNQTNTTI